MTNLAYDDLYFEDIGEEMLNGVIVMMAPKPNLRHYCASDNINSIFKRYIKGKTCRAFGDNVDVYLTELDRVVPDAMIVCKKDIIKETGVHGSPDLIVEVLSPSTAKRDKGYKKDLYERCGVKEYWIVDINNKSIEIYLLLNGKYKLDNVYIIQPDYMLEGMTEEEKAELVYEFKTSLFDDFIIDIREVFEDIDI